MEGLLEVVGVTRDRASDMIFYNDFFMFVCVGECVWCMLELLKSMRIGVDKGVIV